VLITKSGSIYEDPEHRYTEMTINVNCFNVMAKKVFTSQQHRTTEMDVRVAVVVQGHSDDELPEQILGAAEMHHIDWSRATMLDE